MTTTDTAFINSAAAGVIAALDSPLRIAIISRLAERDHFVHELVKATGKSQPLISQHLRVLKQAGIVDSERSGREVTYSLIAPRVLDLLADAAKIAS
ncbi:metalloregulator ArsR/SmtB family transcription factor [Corynebacterium sp. MSK158]|uniref:ArsR/SmtB family transcription factor n=1 Tax=Corynebacterium sp. MSK158 TaxID=3050212 RepID=UPI002549EDA4|nr:metalloregulator ArsR/SmtB family transcription factor [Corynebacterium sp. MSK158]MDK8693823.1 metalloregulator ArsR/SmtB family transcription factor [Corynebacterium sp. MSK158]